MKLSALKLLLTLLVIGLFGAGCANQQQQEKTLKIQNLVHVLILIWVRFIFNKDN